MSMTMTQKILAKHAGLDSVVAGQLIEAKLDMVLGNDVTSPVAINEMTKFGKNSVFDRTKISLVMDHFTPNKDIQSAQNCKQVREFAKKYDITHYYDVGNMGIEHALLPEQGVVTCGDCIIGADSHTCTYGALGAFSTGVGSTDMAAGMVTGKAWFKVPSAIKVVITGKKAPCISGKDVVLHLIGEIGVDGALYKSLEFTGDGIKELSMDDRLCISNMAIECGAKNGIFPVDDITLEYVKGRSERPYEVYEADEDAEYDEVIDIDLCSLTPMAACPHMPDNVKTTDEIGKIKVDQVAIGSCTNSSFVDMMKVASILKGKTIAPSVSLCIAPGSKQVLNMLALNGALSDMISAGARILESACGPCIGMGQSPNSGGVSLRTFNRNFEGRSGTKDGQIYLVSPEVAAASALTGYLTDPRELGDAPKISMPEHFIVNDNMIEAPASPEDADKVEVLRGPNIKPFPKTEKLPEDITAKAVLKVGDNITTDHIMPAGAKILPYRSNIPHLSQYCFAVCDETFPERIKAEGKGFIVGGANYGQGSSREHAALVPLYLGVKAVITKSFARIHVANLVNAGILPFTFANEEDYDKIDQMDELSLPNIKDAIENNKPVVLKNLTKGEEYQLNSSHLSARQRAMLVCGGLLDYTREMNK